jgi:hypothetical protein
MNVTTHLCLVVGEEYVELSLHSQGQGSSYWFIVSMVVTVFMMKFVVIYFCVYRVPRLVV